MSIPPKGSTRSGDLPTRQRQTKTDASKAGRAVLLLGLLFGAGLCFHASNPIPERQGRPESVPAGASSARVTKGALVAMSQPTSSAASPDSELRAISRSPPPAQYDDSENLPALGLMYRQRFNIETWENNSVQLSPEKEHQLEDLEQKYAEVTATATAYRDAETIDMARARRLRAEIADAFYRDLREILSRSEVLDYLRTMRFGGPLADEMNRIFAERAAQGVLETPLDRVFYFTQFARIESSLPKIIVDRLEHQSEELLQRVSVAVFRGLLDDKLMRIQYRYGVTGVLPDGGESIYKVGLDVDYNVRIWMLIALQDRLYQIVGESEGRRAVLARETQDWFQAKIGLSRNQAQAFSESPLGTFLHYYPGP